MVKRKKKSGLFVWVPFSTAGGIRGQRRSYKQGSAGKWRLSGLKANS